jgi:fibrillarin-like pre-rRNA processing protein
MKSGGKHGRDNGQRRQSPSNHGGRPRNPPRNFSSGRQEGTPWRGERARHTLQPRMGGREQEKTPSDNRNFEGVYKIEGKFATRNSTPKYKVYGEKTANKGGVEYRIWDPYRSKVAAALVKGLKVFPIKPASSVLYLGASSGTTASHIADIAQTVYCVEFSKRMMRDLLSVCERKQNMIPILGDARRPWEYSSMVGAVDVVIQDVAQPDQAGILMNNLDQFKFRHGLIAIKARSISSVRDPQQVFKSEVERIRTRFNVLQEINLAPFEEDHILVAVEAR